MGDQQPTRSKQGGTGPFAAVSTFGRRVIAWALVRKPVRAVLLYLEHHGPMLADSVTYRALFSVFAGVFLGFAIAGVWLAGRPDAIDALVDTLDAVIPGLVGDDGLIDPDDLVQPLTLSIAGALALVGLVGAAIGAIGSLRIAFRSLGDLPDDQTFFVWIVARDLVLAVGFGVLLAATAAVTFFGTAAVDTVFGWFGVSNRDPAYDGTVRVLSIVLILVIDTVVVAAMFRILSGLRPSARSLWSGAVIGGIGLTGLQELSSLFVRGATANPLLVSFGSLIALLLWFNLSSQVILIAAAYIVTGIDDEHDRVGARYGAPTIAMRRMQRAERRASIAAAELADARAVVERERAASRGG
ncbi:YihY/virulence factor BrkB family protein [Agromyces sp. SYSU K20354]|uniref:YihY/virulence factor BrkB family protein n=1 Tax=Agromyces cavernae TaxID=2898659 RepID=UPI001E2B10A9|nr:YihY/virulence factor BrkB family protein [Agromyces cavernae]MCD2441885.1 YihY/virulence factor BrkB family protein [Agromyces cavernae]